MSNDPEDVLRQAEAAAEKGELFNQLRASLRDLIDTWPNDGLPTLTRAMIEARKHLSDETLRDWRRGNG